MKYIEQLEKLAKQIAEIMAEKDCPFNETEHEYICDNKRFVLKITLQEKKHDK